MNILPIIFLCLNIVSIQPNTIEKDNNQPTINNSNVYEEHYDNVQANQEDDSINSFSFNVDSYEPNDGYNSATKLSPNNFYSLDAYTVNIDAILDYDSMLKDDDFYYITLFTDSVVRISVEADPSCSESFDFAVLGYEYNNLGSYAYHDVDYVYSNFDGTTYAYFNETLKAGTYFIYLRGRQNSMISNDLPYSMEVIVTKTEEFYDVFIPDLKGQENIKGALWISDLVPSRNISVFDLNSEYVYYLPHETNLNYPDYALDELRAVSNGEPVKVATYYIWDPVIKYVLHEIFIVVRNELHNIFEENEQAAVELELKLDQITNTLSVVFTVVGLFTNSIVVGITLDIISEVTFFAIESYFDSIIPELCVNDVEYMSLLSSLASYTDLGVRPEDKPTMTVEGIYSHDTEREVVQIPIYYNLGVRESIFPNFNEHYYSYKATSSVFFNTDSLLYLYDFIQSSYDDDYYCRGKIYKISEFEDLVNIENLELAEEHVHNYTYEDQGNEHLASCDCGYSFGQSHVNDDHVCVKCDAELTLHDYDRNYVPINQLRHYVECSCGAKTTQGHAVLSGTKRCVLCGQLVDIGFGEITMMTNGRVYITDNGSYILPNGIIVINQADIDNIKEIISFSLTDNLVQYI